MDEQVINDLYQRAQSNGYAKNREEFIKLLHNDNDVFNDMFSYVKGKGYQKNENDFSTLIGKTVGPNLEQSKKKRLIEVQKPSTALPLEDGSLASQKLSKVEKAVEVPDDYKRINSLSNKYTPVVSLDKEGKTVFTERPEGLVEIDLFPEFTANKKKDPMAMREAASRLRGNIEEKINDINTGKRKVHYLSDRKDKLEKDLNEVKALQIKANKEVWTLDDAEYEETIATERVDQSGSIAKKAFNRVMAAISPYKSIQLMSNETSYNKRKLGPEFSLGMKVLSGIEPVEYERVLSALKNDEPISSTDIANITAYGYDIKDERLKKEAKKIEDKYSSQLDLLKNDIQKYESAINNKKTLSESDIADYNSKITNYNAILKEINPLQEKSENLRKAKEDNLLNSPEVLRSVISEDVAERLHNLKKGINPDFKSEFLFGHTWNYTDDEIKLAAEEGLKEFGIDPNDKRVVAAIKYLQDNEGVWLFQNSIAKSGGIRELGKGVSGVISGMSNFVENLPKSEYEIYAEAKSAGSVNVAEKRLKEQDEGVIGVANDVLKGVGQFGAQAGIMYLTGGAIGAGGKAILGRAGTAALAGDIAIADMSVGNLIGSALLKAKNPLSVVTTTYAMEYDSNLKQALSYTSDNSLARNAAALNTAISSATELILSPLDIAKGIVKKFSKGETKDLLNILSDKSLKNDPSKLKSYITKAIKGVGGAGKVVVAEILEEEVVAVADYLTNQYLNPESESFQNRKLSSEMAEVAYQTGVSMALPAILNGVGSANANTFSKSAILVASQNRLKMIEGLGVSLANKNISKEEYAEQVQLVNISAKANDEMPNKADGIKLNADEKANYIWSRVTESFMNDKMKATDDEAQKMILKKKIAEQQNYRAKILGGEEILVKPSYKVDDNEVSKDEFVSLMDSEGSDRFRFEVTGDSEMKDKLRSEAGLQQEEAPEVTSKRTDRIAEIENTLRINETNSTVEGGLTLPNEVKTKLQTELETLKTEQDAIQKQAAGQVPVLTETGVSQEVPQGLSQTGLEVAATGTQAAIENEKPKILSTVEETLGALNTLPTEEKTNYTFTNEKGEEVPLNSNEKVAAELFHQAIAVPEEERTVSQQSAVDAIEVSLKTQIDEQKAGSGVVDVEATAKALEGKNLDNIKIKSIYRGIPNEEFDANIEKPLFFSSSKKVAQHFIGGYENAREEAIAEGYDIAPHTNIIKEAVANSEKTAIYDNDVDVMVTSSEFLDKLNVDEKTKTEIQDYIDERFKNKDLKLEAWIYYNYADNPSFFNILKKNGYDAFEIFEKGDKAYAIIDRSILKTKAQSVAEAYHKSKADGSNPELVKAVEQSLTNKNQENEKVQSQRTGDGTGRIDSGKITPLEGTPSVQGINGPDAQLFAVAEQYATDNGIDLKRQGEYVKVDEERAERIANAYEEMANDPQNPKVKEAYAELIKQTIAQYKALVDAGYKFWFIDLNIPSNVEYASSPFNAMRDLRQNKTIGVFSTVDGFGTSDLDVSNNPLLEDTGIEWALGGLDGETMIPVLANDLFRAVHDAFGHGLEGSGFRARGEENAWQAHVRLFTGSAIGAMTSETRGQNSWLNYGPNGEQNKTASAEDTIFADQKTGLMPEWTWTEGRAIDMEVTPEEQAAPEADINELMTADTKDPAVLEKIFNALDGIDKSIDKFLKSGPNSVTTVIPLGAMKIIVKALKALVKGGMMLQDAIKKVAADNNVKEADIISSLTIINSTEANVPEGLSEGDLPGFDRMMEQVEGIVQKSKDKGLDEVKIKDNVMQYVMKSKVYETASDIQREKLVREVNKMFGVREKSAPSVGRILGTIKDINKITMSEKTALVKQIKDLARGARDAKTAIAIATQQLSREVKELRKQGKLTATQVANVVIKFGKVNMLSEISVSNFVDYMTNVFKDAEYAFKLNIAKNLKSSISSLSKNKEKNADLKELAKQFIDIDPSMAEDIDAYNEMAAKIKEAIKGSTIRGQNISLAQTVDIGVSLEYILKTLNAQNKLMRERKAEEIQQLMGVDASEFSYEDMVDLLATDKPITKYNEGIIRSTINKMFNVFSAMINENIKRGGDPITGKKVDYTNEQKRIIIDFMNMDLSILSEKQSLESVDALANFLQNKSTAKMGAMMAGYKGIMGTKTAVKENLKAQVLKKYGLEWLGKLLSDNLTNLNILFERMFKGFNKGNRIQDLMGITKVINNKAAAQKESSNKVKDYVEKFYKKIANGEAFNTAYNNVERGISSFMQRTIIGSKSQKRDFFDTRKKLIKQSIEVLSEGNDKEKEKAKIYQKVYDKLVKDSNSIDEVKKNTDATNLDGIKYWQNSWSQKFDQLYNTALNIYNKILYRDIDYTPDRYAKLSSDTGQVDLANDQSAFLNNNDVLYQKESGVLIESKRPNTLPKGSYLDFSFDNNNANSYYDALVDIATAEPIKQVQGFLNSPLYKKVVPNADDANVLKSRIQLFINNFRNKNPYDNDSFSKFVKSLDVLAEIGASMALGGLTQPLKQVIPVAVNTLFNAGGLDITAPFNKAKSNFMTNSGYGISNRGAESQAQIQSMNILIEEAAKSSPEKLLRLIRKGNQFYLKKFLVNADSYIARASWITYYEKYLKDNGVDTKGIDYSTHKLNEDAANYAQRMVDRQQNVSDTDLSGKIFVSKAPAVKILVKTIMPFAGFRMNQASRLGSDIAVVTDNTATKEDKTIAIRSLMGYATENVTFRLLSSYIAYQLGTAGLMLLGRGEGEEEKEKRKNNLIKGQITGTVTDILSPAPIADKFVQSKVNDLVGVVQTAMDIPLDKQYNIFGESKQDYVQNMGMYGIASERASQLVEISMLAATGKYTDDFGKQKTILKKDQETLKPFIGLGVLSSLGLAPSEVNSVLRYMIKAAKKAPGKTAEEIQETQERLEEKQEDTDRKLEVLEKLRESTTANKELDVINEKIDELNDTPEEKKEKAKENKEENKEERKLKEELLTDFKTGVEYDNETELKKYNPSLYDKNFGPQSKWYKEHKVENEVEKMLRKELRLKEDKEYNYRSTESGGLFGNSGSKKNQGLFKSSDGGGGLFGTPSSKKKKKW